MLSGGQAARKAFGGEERSSIIRETGEIYTTISNTQGEIAKGGSPSEKGRRKMRARLEKKGESEPREQITEGIAEKRGPPFF